MKEGFGRCYESHPVLKVGGGELFGGNCHDPVPGCDMYVVLDGLHGKPGSGSVHLIIPNMGVVPRRDVDPVVDGMLRVLKRGGRVHVGCIGGHGRTGLVLSVLMWRLGEADPIKWLRCNYCTKAVESKAQVDWLSREYGMPKASVPKRRHLYEGAARQAFSRPWARPGTDIAVTAWKWRAVGPSVWRT